jgi:SAM-dependent methyltransferase
MHDSYPQFHRDLFFDLLPPPGRRTLDLGCGEGRLSRDLQAIGHHIVGVDASPTMIAAASTADPTSHLYVADAARLPFADGSFDCVVAFMSLQDVDDFRGAIAEAGRVLEQNGRLCVAIVHPITSAADWNKTPPDGPLAIIPSYLEPFAYADNVVRDGLEITFVSEHRPISAYTDAIAETGLLIETIREPPLPDHAVLSPRHRRWQRIPLFLHIRALKP